MPVEVRIFDGVTYEFFGMGAVVPESQEAVDLATANLRLAFGGGTGAATTGTEGLVDVAPAADANASCPKDASAGEVTDVEATAAQDAGADAEVEAGTEAGAGLEGSEPVESETAPDQ